MAARPAGHHQRRRAERGTRTAGRGQRRRLLRARLLGTVRAVLAFGCARGDRRAVAVQHQRAPGTRDAGGDLLPEPRRRRRDGGRLGCAHGGAQGRRRHHRQRSVHADPGRRARCRRRQAGGRRDDGAGRRLRGRPRGRVLGEPRRPAGQLAGGQALDARVERRPARGGYAGWQKAVQRTLDWVDVE